MYHPHLFARRAELLAIRDVAETIAAAEKTISPIFEAVKADSSDLNRALTVLGKCKLSASVILNPIAGDFKNTSLIDPWRKSLTAVFSEFKNILPAFVCRPTSTAQQMNNFIGAYPDQATMLLYWSPKISDADLKYFAKSPNVRFHVNLLNQMSAARRDLLPKDKAIDVQDHFAKCVRNADYGGPEFFSDDHLTYLSNSTGFGDYSITGAKFVPGGGAAHAVAIHGMYRAQGNALWVEHFVSDDTDKDVGTVEGKYLQAAGKLIVAVDDRPTEFGSDMALTGFRADVTNQTYPGLATSKRRQIYHHLALVHQLLASS